MENFPGINICVAHSSQSEWDGGYFYKYFLGLHCQSIAEPEYVQKPLKIGGEVAIGGVFC